MSVQEVAGNAAAYPMRSAAKHIKGFQDIMLLRSQVMLGRMGCIAKLCNPGEASRPAARNVKAPNDVLQSASCKQAHERTL